ncbi:MAG: Clp protease ClpP, partial [Clostridia bacterium]|nr:Clp protease ClpP [Clostridia bacterium]
IDEAVMASYEPKFVGTKEELTDLLANETWLNASECFDLGFCTKLLEDEPQPQVNVKESILAKYKKTEPKADEKPAFFNAFKK